MQRDTKDKAMADGHVLRPDPGFGSRMGGYDHLNRELAMPFDLDAFARFMVEQNYGTQRLLSAVVRASREKQARLQEEYDREGLGLTVKTPLIDAIEYGLDNGLCA